MRYVRSIGIGLIAALAPWCAGMFIAWDAYPFWLVGEHSFDGAGMTRLMMLYAGGAGAFVWFRLKEARQ